MGGGGTVSGDNGHAFIGEGCLGGWVVRRRGGVVARGWVYMLLTDYAYPPLPVSTP